MTTLSIIFLCVTLIALLKIFYAYVGYAMLLKVIGKPKPIALPTAAFTPPVSILCAVYQGKDSIQKKIENSFASNYPSDKIEFLIVTDGSDDGTPEIIESIGNPRVKLIRQEPRQGKTAAQKKGIAAASHEILICTDLTTMLEPDSIRELVKPLADESIGLVSSEDIWVNSDGSATQSAQGAYVKYEMWLRNRESSINSIVSASGCFYAVRKKFFEPIPDFLIDDIVIPMTVVEHGARAIHRSEARSLVPMIPKADKEFPRRARMTLGGINALWYKAHMLNPFRYGLFALQLASHKLARWMVPFWMLLLLIVPTIAIVMNLEWRLFWGGLLFAQLLAYLVALVGYLKRNDGSTPAPIRLIYFLVSSNLALLLSWYYFFTNPKQTTWSQSRG